MNPVDDHDASQPLQVENLVTGKVEGVSIQAGTIHGGVHVNNFPSDAKSEVSVELMMGFGDGVVERAAMPFAASKGVRLISGNMCLGVQSENSGLIAAEVSSVSIDFRRTGDAEAAFVPVAVPYRPGHGTGPLPYWLKSRTEASWFADTVALVRDLLYVHGEVPWHDLVMRARARVSTVGFVAGDWHPLHR